MSVSLSLLVLRATDVEETVAFYGKLGLTFQQEQHGSGPVHYAAQLSETVLEIYPLKAGQTEADESTMLGFAVGSLERTLETLIIDAQIKSSDWVRFCSVKDPDGRTVRLSEVTPKS